jgi:hypothetical protein
MGELPVSDADEPVARPPKPDDDGPVLPTTSPEDRDEAWGDEPRASERDAEWYQRERPPHHE